MGASSVTVGMSMLASPALTRNAAFATDDDQSFESVLKPILSDTSKTLWVFEWVVSRSPENRAAAGQYAGDRSPVQLNHIILGQPQPAVANAQDLNFVHVSASDYGANRSVKPRTITASS